MHTLSIKNVFKGLDIYGLRLLPTGLWPKTGVNPVASILGQITEESVHADGRHWQIQSCLLPTDG